MGDHASMDMDPDMEMAPETDSDSEPPSDPEPTAEVESAASGLVASVSGSLYWGGMSGQLTLINSGDTSLTDWSYTFRTTQADVKVWSSTYDVVDLGDGTYEVTVGPPSWGASIPAGGSLSLSFNAVSVDLPNSGTLTDEMFFADSTGADLSSEPEPSLEPEPEPVLEPQPEPEPETQPEAEAPTADARRPMPTADAAPSPARVFEVDVYSGGHRLRAGIDRLDFGDKSVHNLILGKTEEGYVTFLSPWNDAQKMTLVGVTYDQLALGDYGVVGNEHLRQDLGGVVSWELGVGEGSQHRLHPFARVREGRDHQRL